MRSPEDIINIRATVSRRLSLDLERLEQDPVWNQICTRWPSSELDLKEAVRAYIFHYISLDRFPHQMPSTNGPGEIDTVILETN